MTRNIDKATRKYLADWAEPEIRIAESIERSPGTPYGHLLVIPAHGECESLEALLASLPTGPLGRVLVIVVVNESEASPDWAHAENLRLLDALEKHADERRSIGPHATLGRVAAADLLLIDRTLPETRLPRGQGVGLARKIGCDVALALILSGRVRSRWIHCTDADALLPDDYFARLPGFDAATSALVYDFEHFADGPPETWEAALRYEIYLRYYVAGLRSAGSRYAHHSLGSILAIDPTAYARVRGFPRRRAAEDFHLLNKLAKQAPIRRLAGSPIRLSGRISERVPFGTGPAIAKEVERQRRGDPFPAYDPRVFAALGIWLEVLDRAVEQGESERFVGVLEDSVARSCLESGRIDADVLLSALHATGALTRAGATLGSTAPGATRARRLRDGFDALRTLKLIHALRDHAWPSLPLCDAIAEADFLGLEDEAHGDLTTLRRCLADREAAINDR